MSGARVASKPGRTEVIAALAADLTFQSDTAPRDIPGLTFNLGGSATEVWVVHGLLVVQAASTTMDGKLHWVRPTGSGGYWGFVGASTTQSGFGGLASSSNPSAIPAITADLPFGTNAAIIGVSFWAMVRGGSTAGAMQLQVAQNTSEAADLTVMRGASIIATKVAS